MIAVRFTIPFLVSFSGLNRDWILATGNWDDSAFWVDTEVWNDG